MHGGRARGLQLAGNAHSHAYPHASTRACSAPVYHAHSLRRGTEAVDPRPRAWLARCGHRGCTGGGEAYNESEQEAPATKEPGVDVRGSGSPRATPVLGAAAVTGTCS